MGWYVWAESGQLCYEQKQAGGSRLVRVEIGSGKERELIGIEGARIESPIARHAVPHAILVSLRLPGATEDDVYRIDLGTGERVLDTKNPGGVSPHRFTADEALVVRAVQRTTADGGTEVPMRDGPCAAASSTTANLVAFVNGFPKTPGNAWVRSTIGDPEIPGEAERLRSVSPFFLVDRLEKPLLMARGANDGALPPGDLDAFLAEIGKRGGHAASVVYEGDGHFFRRENELDYYARVERLFARHLGGRAEAMPGDKLPGSTAVVKVVGRPFD